MFHPSNYLKRIKVHLRRLEPKFKNCFSFDHRLPLTIKKCEQMFGKISLKHTSSRTLFERRRPYAKRVRFPLPLKQVS